MEFNYYYEEEAERFSFIRIPKTMLTEERFFSLSLSAKVLYGLLLDRMSLSLKNGWLDEEKRVFIIFKIEEIQEVLGFSKKKSIEYLNELEQFGLVEKKRRGLGLPSILYIKNFMLPNNNAQNDENGTSRGVEIDTSVKAANISNSGVYTEKTCKSDQKCPAITGNGEKFCVRGVDLGTSRGVENALQEVSVSTPLKNNTKDNNTDINNTSPILSIKGDKIDWMEEYQDYSEIIRDNIEYDALCERHPLENDIVDGIFDLILETVISRKDSVFVSGQEYPAALVKSKFLKLNYSHIEYVIGCMGKNTTKVHNIKAYLIAALFNAGSTMGSYYKAEVNHDMPQLSG